MGESLQVNYQVVWRLIYFHLFLCVDVSLALAAVPLIVATQSFFRTEKVHTVVDRHCLRGTILQLIAVTFSLILLHNHRLFNEKEICLRLPVPVRHQNEISAFQLFEKSPKVRCVFHDAKIAIILVFFVTDFALFARIEKGPRDLTNVIIEL